MSKRKPPIGSRWRVLVHAARGPRRIDVDSDNYDKPMVFDELVIDNWFHLEQMDRDTWWICIGDENRMVRIGRDGKVTVGEMYK